MSGIPYKNGGGSLFYPESFIYNQQIASGQTGTLVTIGTAGKITELTYLATASTTNQTGISVDIDGSNVIPTGILADNSPNTAGHFGIFSTASNSLGSIGVPTTIRGEFISIIKDPGNTLQGLVYSYVTGIIK
jgi:hypothetical protein